MENKGHCEVFLHCCCSVWDHWLKGCVPVYQNSFFLNALWEWIWALWTFALCQLALRHFLRKEFWSSFHCAWVAGSCRIHDFVAPVFSVIAASSSPGGDFIGSVPPLQQLSLAPKCRFQQVPWVEYHGGLFTILWAMNTALSTRSGSEPWVISGGGEPPKFPWDLYLSPWVSGSSLRLLILGTSGFSCFLLAKTTWLEFPVTVNNSFDETPSLLVSFSQLDLDWYRWGIHIDSRFPLSLFFHL